LRLHQLVTNDNNITMSASLQVEEIKKAILALPDKEIGPLRNWLEDYLNDEVWPREIAADIEEFGVEDWKRMLREGMAQSGEKHQAVLRLMNTMQFRSDADRDQCLKDFQLIVGEALTEEDASTGGD
jgi:hypothetical protein